MDEERMGAVSGSEGKIGQRKQREDKRANEPVVHTSADGDEDGSADRRKEDPRLDRHALSVRRQLGGKEVITRHQPNDFKRAPRGPDLLVVDVHLPREVEGEVDESAGGHGRVPRGERPETVLRQ